MKQIFYIPILILALFFSFLASGTETALFSLSKEDKNRLPFEKKKRRIIDRIFLYPSLIIIAVVSINTFSNTLASTIFSNLTFNLVNLNKNALEIIDTLVFGTILFIFCETLPKNIAFKSPIRFTKRFFKFIELFIYPLSAPFEKKKQEKEIRKIYKNFHFLHEIELILFTGEVKEILTQTERLLFLKIIEMLSTRAKNFTKIKNIKTSDFIEVSEEENLLNIFKKLLSSKKDYAKIITKKGDSIGFIEKKDITVYLFENV